MTHIVPANICSIKIYNKLQNPYIIWFPENRFLGFITQGAGFYDSVFGDSIDFKDYPNSYVEGNDVFYKPHLTIRTSDDVKHYKFFESVELLEEFLEEWKSILGKLINIP